MLESHVDLAENENIFGVPFPFFLDLSTKTEQKIIISQDI